MNALICMNSLVVRNYQVIRAHIREACGRCGRRVEDIRLVAASKTVGEKGIHQLYKAGHREFGENRLQEALSKLGQLPDDIIWHFIGRLQKNKIRKIVAHFPFIHSVDSLKIAESLDTVAGEFGVHPRVFLQINLANEQSKGGFGVTEIENVLPRLIALSNLQVCGLMCLPPNGEKSEDSRPYFRELRLLRDRLQDSYGCVLPHLSMGMSHDYSVAIEEGATFIRVGSCLFGERTPTALPKTPES